MDLKAMIKYIIELGLNGHDLAAMKRLTGHKVFLLLSPQYLNYGDHAIALSEIMTLQRLFPEVNIVDANYSLFDYWSGRVKAAATEGDVILVTGGGYMGNLWPKNQALTEKVVETFPHNRIVFAPQTIFYRDTPSAAQEKAAFRDKLLKHGNFFFYGRDEQSCRLMGEMGFVRGRDFDLMPDFVLLMPPDDRLTLRNGRAALCLRDDGEALTGLNGQIRNALADVVPGRVDSIKMAQNHVEIPVRLRERFVHNKLQQFANAGVVITDRLHGMIYAASTGTPCVAFDNVSRKVSGVYQWIRTLDYVAVARDVSELPDLITRVMSQPKCKNRDAFIALQRQLSEEYLPAFAAQLR